MSITNILLFAIAIGIWIIIAKANAAMGLIKQVLAELRKSPEEIQAIEQRSNAWKSIEWHLGGAHNLLTKIESHTCYLTEPVKEARMKEILDAVPK